LTIDWEDKVAQVENGVSRLTEFMGCWINLSENDEIDLRNVSQHKLWYNAK
jgi:hypothetical protein